MKSFSLSVESNKSLQKNQAVPPIQTDGDAQINIQNLLSDVDQAIDTPDSGQLNSPDQNNFENNGLPIEDGIAPDRIEDNQDNSAFLPPASDIPDDDTRASSAPEEDVFYDAEAFVPRGEMARNVPRKVDPKSEPAQRFLIVRKNAEMDSRSAKLVGAERALKLGRYSSALEIYNRLYEKNKKDVQVLMGRAIALQKLGLDEEAILAYETLLDINPDNTEARINMLGILSRKFPAIATRQLKDLAEKNPDNVALFAQIAVSEAQAGNFDSAIRYMGVATSMDPNNATNYYNLAIIADQAGAKNDAVKYYEMALETDTIYGGGKSIPRDQVYTRLAQIR